MYVCPICKKTYKSDELVAKCFLTCWKQQNPTVKSANAPRSEDIVERQCSSDIEEFFRKAAENGSKS